MSDEPKDRPLRVYIASPYTLGDVGRNVHESMRAADELVKLGHVPYAPLLSHLWHLIIPHTPDFWYRLDLRWLEACDIVLRLPGQSVGADNEVKRALELGMPVGFSIEEIRRRWPAESVVSRDPVVDMARQMAEVTAEAPATASTEAEDILTEAYRVTHGPRRDAYGTPLDDWERTAALWTPILEKWKQMPQGTPLPAELAALCMIQVKVSREVNRHGTDNLADMAGYAWVADEIVKERARQRKEAMAKAQEAA
jgi:hypothetical protein